MQQEISATTASLSRVAQPQMGRCFEAPASKASCAFSRDVLVESPGYLKHRARNSLLSLLAHVAGIAALLALPLLSGTAPRLVLYRRGVMFLTAPPPPLKQSPAHSQAFTERVFPSLRLIPPVPPSRRSAPDPSALLPSASLLKSAISFGSDGVLGGILPDRPARFVLPSPPENLRVVHLGGEIKNSRPLYELTLPYPALAKAARIIGRVVIQAVIDQTGRVIHVRAVSGPFLLSVAAIEAVSKERFEPVLLDGQPIQSDLQVQISFHLPGPDF